MKLKCAYSIKISALLICMFSLSVASRAEAKREAGSISGVSFEKVSLKDAFWLPWQKKQADVTIPAALNNTQNAVDNLKIAGQMTRGEACPPPKNLVRFISSDLYKTMESAAYSLMVTPNPKLEKRLDDIIDIIASAQQKDGYLFVPHICKLKIGGIGDRPYSNVAISHELYNVGHMYEGAVAYYRATGKDKWLKVSEKNARHIDKVFFEGDPNYNGGKPVLEAPGHEEIELALCKLSVATGDPFYLDLAKKFLDLRGNNEFATKNGRPPKGSPEYLTLAYSQQHEPAADQREPAGHSVRALYLYTGMASADALSGKNSYNQALEAIWNNLVSTRMHITGGLGAIQAIEGFGREYYLPNKTTYNETCAAVANVFFNHEMFLKTRDSKYLDILELSLFNGALSGIGLGGDTFFYENPLEADGVSYFNQGSKERVKWMSCACCPPNISRLLMQVSGFFYSHDSSKNVWVGLYASNEANFEFARENLKISQTSDYPFDGKVKLRLFPTHSKKFALRLRIPAWAESGQFVPGGLYKFAFENRLKPVLKINGEKADYEVEKGFAVLDRTWSNGDLVELELPMPARIVKCDERVEANRGRIAVTRGPIVYCAEEADNGPAQKIIVRESAAVEKAAKADAFTGGPLKGISFIKIPCKKLGESGASEALLIPYFAWNNRGGASMSVWLPVSEEVAQSSSLGGDNPANKLIEKITPSDGSQMADALFDGMVPKSSSEIDVPAWRIGKYDKDGFAHLDIKFRKPVILESVAAYFNTRPNIDMPKTWKVQYSLENSPFKDMELYMTDSYTVDKDKFNRVHPSSPLKCDALRVSFAKGKTWILVSELALSVQEE